MNVQKIKGVLNLGRGMDPSTIKCRLRDMSGVQDLADTIVVRCAWKDGTKKRIKKLRIRFSSGVFCQCCGWDNRADFSRLNGDSISIG